MIDDFDDEFLQKVPLNGFNFTGKIDSVLNPSGGSITADSIGELIIQKDKVDPCKTRIICREGGCPCCACM